MVGQNILEFFSDPEVVEYIMSSGILQSGCFLYIVTFTYPVLMKVGLLKSQTIF